MALLQISEPGESTVPHQRRLAVGIDLGTTHSLVAAVRSSQADVLPDAQDRRLTPSVVRYQSDGSVVVGWEALEQIAQDPKNTIASVKRLMGRGHDDAVRQRTPYQLAVQESGRLVRSEYRRSPVRSHPWRSRPRSCASFADRRSRPSEMSWSGL